MALARLALALLWTALAVGLIMLIKLGYDRPWTGFGASVDATGETTAAKSLWDWLDLLIVPIVLAIGAWLLDGSRKRSERGVEEERQRQQTLEQYFDYMTPLLSEGKLETSGVPNRLRSLARTRTLSALRLLDGGRKAQLIQFIYEAALIGKSPVIDLVGANLDRADFSEATLAGAEVRGAYLRNASLRGANLRGADLRGSDFSGADLRGADLSGADLRQAIMRGAKLHDADLGNARVDQIETESVRPRAIRDKLKSGGFIQPGETNGG